MTRIMERHTNRDTLDRLPETPADVRIPDDISGLTGGEPARRTRTVRWMYWLVPVVVLAAAALMLGIVLRGGDDTTVTREPAIQWTTPTAGPGSTTLGPTEMTPAIQWTTPTAGPGSTTQGPTDMTSATDTDGMTTMDRIVADLG